MISMKFKILLTLILFAILGIFYIYSPSVYSNYKIYYSYLISIPIILILAAGLFPLILAREFDMSFVSIVALSSFIFTYLINLGVNEFISLFACFLTGILCALINAFLVLNINVNSIIATIGTSFLIRGIATILCGGLSISLDNDIKYLNYIFTYRLFDTIPMQSIWAVLVYIFLYLLIFRLKIGSGILFCGDKASLMMGYKPKLIKLSLFINSGILSSLAGVILSIEFSNWWPSLADGYMLIIFAAIFIGGISSNGGKGSVYGVFIGCIIIGILESGIVAMGYDAYYTRFVYGLIIVLCVAFYSILRNKL